MDKKKLIEDLIRQVKQLSFEDHAGSDKFKTRAVMILDNIYGYGRGYSTELLNIDLYPEYMLNSHEEHKAYWEDGKQKIQNLLETILEEMELFPDREAEIAGQSEKAQKPDMDSLTTKGKRDQFLVKLNEMSEGDINKFIDTMEIGKTLGFDRATTFNYARYFVEKGFIKPRDDADGRISITAEGIDEVDRLQSRTVAPSSDHGNDVFIVHGHDEEAKLSVARHIEKLDLKAIILHEMPNKGRAVIEKFEDYSNAGFAVVLLTPDDVGASQERKEEWQPRARQNVIFELGYFVGKLGRGRVCVLRKGNVEIPSDYEGIIYVEMDKAGAWKQTLIKEMIAAGIRIDPAKLLY